jgi:hypothetical protein
MRNPLKFADLACSGTRVKSFTTVHLGRVGCKMSDGAGSCGVPLWSRKGSGGRSVGTEGDDGFDVRGAAGWNPAGGQTRRQKQDGDDGDRDGVVG